MMKYIEKEILKGRDLEKNISDYVIQMMDYYGRYSCVRLSMNYFTYYEMSDEGGKDKKRQKLTERFHEVIKGILEGGDTEKLISVLTGLRQEVITIMSELTACVDILNIYEYCFNRIEYRYQDGSRFLKQTDEEVTRDILNYILNEKDNVVINGKICEVVRQLPLHMTKGRFFELLKEGMKVYKESEKGSVDDFLYMLRTVAMLDTADAPSKVSEEIGLICRKFAEADLKNLTQEEFQQLQEKLQFAADYIQESVSHYMLLAENINDAYVMLLTNQDFLKQLCPVLAKAYEENQDELLQDRRDYDNCTRLLEKEYLLYHGTDYEEICEEIEDGFLYLEGKQEKYAGLFQKYAYLTDQLTEQHLEELKKLGLMPVMENFTKITKLVSGSIFVEFDDEDEKHEIAGLEYIEEKYGQLEKQLTDLFDRSEKPVNRAVMAHILSELPVFFGNVEEIKNYVYRSLNACTDLAEKAAVVQILESMMQEE